MSTNSSIEAKIYCNVSLKFLSSFSICSMVVRVEKARDLPLIYTSITSSAADGKSPLVVVHWLFPPQ